MSELFAFRPGERIAVMGVGNALCADDGAGMLFAELVRDEAEKAGVLVLEASTAPENFSGALRVFRPDVLLIVDAANLAEPPGAVRPVPEEQIGGTAFSTHMLPLSFLISYLAAECGCRVQVLGVQPASVQPGDGMCAAVRQAVDGLAKAFLAALGEAAGAPQA